jgi:hypothetical protein
VTDERDAPWQIILGLMDTVFCVLASLSLWMKLNLRCIPNASLSPYIFGNNSILSGGKKSKVTAHNIFPKFLRWKPLLVSKVVVLLRRAWDVTRFENLQRHMHVVWDAQKMTKTFVVAGNQRLVSQMCTSTELPFPDAKIAELLCIGGAVPLFVSR